MSSFSEPSTGSPISRVPYDVLLEIFIHCLPQYPLSCLQPSTTIAPILLSHVCSSWRTVALASPILWAHLFYCFTIVEKDNADYTCWKIEFDERDIEFIQWWRMKQGSVAPFLSLALYDDNTNGSGDEYDTGYIGQRMTGNAMDLLLEYITSAQYLRLDSFFWSQVRQKMKPGYQVTFPNLHTLTSEPGWHENQSFYHVQSLISAETQPALRRLFIGHDILPEHFIIPKHWSNLTHATLLRVPISVEFWFYFIRAVPSLRCGHFDFQTYLASFDYTKPSQCSLLQLTTLSVAVRIELPNTIEFPLTLLFTNLYLPTLRTLSLSSPVTESWEDHRAITELYGVLKSAPAIVKLILEDRFLSLDVYNTGVLLAAIGGVKPVWNCAAQLTHLQLDIPYIATTTEVQKEEILDIFVRNIFSSNNMWLNLPNSSCPIRTFAISNMRASAHTTDLTMSKIRKNAPQTPEIVFQVTSDSTYLIAAAALNDWAAII